MCMLYISRIVTYRYDSTELLFFRVGEKISLDSLNKSIEDLDAMHRANLKQN